MNHKKIIILSALSITSVVAAPVYSTPDLIVINADVRTSDPKQNRAEAFAVKDSKFSAIGTKIQLEVRGKKHVGKVSELPFFKKSYVK